MRPALIGGRPGSTPTAAKALLTALVLLGSACVGDRQPPQDDGPATSTSTTTGGSSGGTAPDLGAAEESTGWPLPTDDDLLTCVRTCEFPADCCPPNTAGSCPSPAFPYNFMCIEGLCVAPPCMADDDCTNPGEACRVIRGASRCVLPCDGDDATCSAVDMYQTCSGTADDDSLYCLEHCTNPGVFCGNETCDEAIGECLCTSAGQCLVTEECV
jgi:hypothetical protein